MMHFEKPTSAAMCFKSAALFLVALVCLLPPAASAQTLQYHGFLTTSAGAALDGITDISTSIHDAEIAGTELWQETHPAVSVGAGVFSIDLGSLAVFPDELFGEASLWLEVEVNGETLMPRHILTGVPFARRAVVSESLVDDAVEALMIGAAAITPDKLAEVCVEGEVLVMLPGGWGCGSGPCLPRAEICDSLDNDCDGVTDNGVCTVREELDHE